MKRKAVIICPGRGTYNKSELGYIKRNHADKNQTLHHFEAVRRAQGQTPLNDLDDAERFSTKVHTSGDNASGLIFASSYCDALDVFDAFNVVAVTGNSMGWYTTLAVAGAVTAEHGFEIANTMGRLMHESMIGGQIIYPVVDEDWRPNNAARQNLLNTIVAINAQPACHLTVSIDLGGMLVLAGNADGLDAFEAGVPRLQDRFPLRLVNHAAFHSALQEPVAEQGRDAHGQALFGNCRIPMIDGRGMIWWPHSYAAQDLYSYTLGHQITEPYDFSAAIRVAARSFAPDAFIVLGPGDTMGSSVAQSLIAIEWRGLDSKVAFQNRQTAQPVILSMGRPGDRDALRLGSPNK